MQGVAATNDSAMVWAPMNQTSFGPFKLGSQFSQLDMLLDTWSKLGDGERNVLMTFLMRLYAGQRKFGKLTTGKKDWTFEALEEVLDQSVYLCAALSDKTELAFNKAVSDAIAEATPSNNEQDDIPDWIREHLQAEKEASKADF